MSADRWALLLMLVFASLWTLMEALAACLREHYSPFQIVWTRYAVHLAVMVAVWGWREPASLWRTKRPAYQLARSMLMLVMPASWIAAVHLGADADTVMSIFWLAPLAILAFARLFLAETFGLGSWLACGAAVVGAMSVYGLNPVPPPLGIALALAMTLSFASYVAMTRPLRRENVRANLFYTALGVFLALTPAMPTLWILPNPHDLAIFVCVGLIGFAGLYALDRLASAAPVSRSAPMVAMQVVFAVGTGILIGHSPPDLQALVGLLLIGAAAVFAWVRASGIAAPSKVELTT